MLTKVIDWSLRNRLIVGRRPEELRQHADAGTAQRVLLQ